MKSGCHAHLLLTAAPLSAVAQISPYPPLRVSNRTERLMHSARATHGGKRIVKAEWDKFEAWAKARPNGDN